MLFVCLLAQFICSETVLCKTPRLELEADMSVPDSTAGGPLKGANGNSSIQDSAPKKGYSLCFATDVGPALVCRANFQKQQKLKLPSTMCRDSSVKKGTENWMLVNIHP